jgi:hypothetical protein
MAVFRRLGHSATSEHLGRLQKGLLHACASPTRFYTRVAHSFVSLSATQTRASASRNGRNGRNGLTGLTGRLNNLHLRLLKSHLQNCMLPKSLRPLLPYLKRNRWGYAVGTV